MNDQNLDVSENLAENTLPESVDIQAQTQEKPFSKTIFGSIVLSTVFVIVVLFSVLILPNFLQKIAIPISKLGVDSFKNYEEAMAPDKAILEKSIAKLQKQLNDFVPESFYMIINSTDNEFALMKAGQLIRQGQCSTGSYVVLEDHKQRKYLFKTPKGRRKVLSKVTDPVWTKPNWAFIEEGLPVPPANHPSRFEEGVLGDYALKLGDGYMIHGTIWQRYLGLPVTHGCVRLNDADLEAVYKSLDKGAFVYIY
ncbi:MAG: L,D-transpeptidase [Bacteroidales bacterium]|nr:L,D-transpeptidase [Bacteroidales bacterium]